MADKNEKLVAEFQNIAAKLLAEEERLLLKKQKTDWYSVVEQLLEAYKTAKHRVECLADYEFEPRRKDKSISIAPAPGTMVKNFDDVREQAIDERKKSYARTLAQFEEFDSLVQQFNGRKEFVVIRMRYFNEDAEGNELEAGQRLTMEQIAADLNIDVRTARRWRTSIVKEMAAVLGGVDGAISIQRYNGKKENKGE